MTPKPGQRIRWRYTPLAAPWRSSWQYGRVSTPSLVCRGYEDLRGLCYCVMVSPDAAPLSKMEIPLSSYDVELLPTGKGKDASWEPYTGPMPGEG